MRITSTAFADGAAIPKKYTEDGENRSPPLKLEDVPAKAHSLALIVEDPDAPRADPWVHWVMYDIPADVRALPEGIPRQEEVERPISAVQGVNTWSKHNIGYRGPAPPKGHGAHHYHFKAFALDAMLNLSGGIERDALARAMQGRIIAEAELVGVYER